MGWGLGLGYLLHLGIHTLYLLELYRHPVLVLFRLERNRRFLGFEGGELLGGVLLPLQYVQQVVYHLM